LEEVYTADGSASRLPHLNSELAIRPLFHQLEKRVKAHVLVAFLGYACWCPYYKASAEASWFGILTSQSVTAALGVVQRGHRAANNRGREIWLRRTSKLDEEQQKILYQLQLQLPERLEPIQIQKCSADSAIA
jgi:hypothetical protein